MADSITILHVDDDASFAELVQSYFDSNYETFDVDTVNSIEAATDYLAATTPDCVVSDYDMPSGTGIDFLQSVRTTHPNLPFILYTGKGSEDIASEAISAGVTDYLQKETGIGQYTVLANRVQNAVAQHRAKEELTEITEHLSLIADTTDDILFIFNEDWSELLFINDAYEQIWGGTVDELESDPGAFLDYVHPDDYDRAVTAMEEVAAGEPRAIEYRVLHEEGEQLWIRGDTKPQVDEAGSVTRIVGFVRDITEEKARERQLERVNERNRALIEHSSDIIAVLDETGTLQYVSQSSEPILGYEPAALVGENAFEYIHSEDRERALELFQDMVDQPDIVTERVEHRFQHADGSWVPLETIGSNRTNTALDGYVITSREISERREREATLADLRAQHQAAIEAGAIGTWEWDVTADEIVTNRTFAEAFGVDPDQAKAGIAVESFLEAIHPDDVDRVQADIQTTLDTCGSYEATYRVNPDGDTHQWIQARGHVTCDAGGKPIRFDGVAIDVQDRKRREQQLEALNGAVRELFAAPSAEAVSEIGVDAARDIIGLDANAIHRYDEQKAALEPVTSTSPLRELVGELPTLGTGDSIAWQVFESGESRAIDDVHDEPDRHNPDTEVRSELYLPIGDRGILIASSRSVEAFDRETLVLGEILAENIAAALSHVERTERLRQSKRTLTRQNKRLEEFASVVSHDLRNPLNVATGYLELHQAECDSVHLSQIETAHERMHDLIEDLLALSTDGELTRGSVTIDLATLVESCWNTVATGDATIRVEATKVIHANRQRVQQLLENLFRNAVEHGGSDVTVTIGDLPNGFFVADNGPGIPADERQAIFSSGYSTTEGGSGVGLSIILDVVEAHGWSIDVTESAAGGARFEITNVETENG